MNAYNSRPSKDTEFIYDKNAVFEDPVVYIRGQKAITAMIFGIPHIMREWKVWSDNI